MERGSSGQATESAGSVLLRSFINNACIALFKADLGELQQLLCTTVWDLGCLPRSPAPRPGRAGRGTPSNERDGGGTITLPECFISRDLVQGQ